jgi:membrane-bound serine protease (ClpP class)
VGPILLILASLLLYVEINTPGFGWPGALSILFFALYFFGQNVAGLAGHEEMLLFGAGVLLLLIEAFVLPGFGIAGILGIVLVFGSVFMAMIERLPRLPDDGMIPALADIPNLTEALFRMLIVLAGSTGGMMALAAWLPRSRAVNSRLVLGQSLAAGSSIPPAGALARVGAEAVADTDLRPAGKVISGEQILDVVSTGAFVPRGTRVRVVRVEGARIVVEPIE